MSTPVGTKESSDMTLVTQVRNGDTSALDRLIARYQAKTEHIVGRYVDSHAEVLDVCQDIYIKLMRALPRFKQQSSFYTWYYTIILNTIKNYLKKHKNESMKIISIDALNAEKPLFALRDRHSPEHYLIRDEAKQILVNTLKAMPDCLGHAMLLFDVKGMSYDDIAKEMGCPIGTVRSRIYRARHLVEKNIAG